jgi:hypothetical protein
VDGFIEYLSSHYEKVAEIGIGSYDTVALALEARGLNVVATDVRPRAVRLAVVADDVTAPRLPLYRGVQAVYAIRLPPELVPALKRLARGLRVDLLIKPLAGEPTDGTLINYGGDFFYMFPFGG